MRRDVVFYDWARREVGETERFHPRIKIEAVGKIQRNDHSLTTIPDLDKKLVSWHQPADRKQEVTSQILIYDCKLVGHAFIITFCAVICKQLLISLGTSTRWTVSWDVTTDSFS